MNYWINLYETFDSNGVGIITLFVEIEKQIYSSTHRFVEDSDRQKAMGLCFKEISNMLLQRANK